MQIMLTAGVSTLSVLSNLHEVERGGAVIMCCQSGYFLTRCVCTVTDFDTLYNSWINEKKDTVFILKSKEQIEIFYSPQLEAITPVGGGGKTSGNECSYSRIYIEFLSIELIAAQYRLLVQYSELFVKISYSLTNFSFTCMMNMIK